MWKKLKLRWWKYNRKKRRIITLPKGHNALLTPHFSADEFDCKCTYPECTTTTIDLDHVEWVEQLRQAIDIPIIITSAYRCSHHNLDVGGKPGSYHLVGKATDLKLKDDQIHKYIDLLDLSDGMGTYGTFIHIDSRGYKARWRG